MYDWVATAFNQIDKANPYHRSDNGEFCSPGEPGCDLHVKDDYIRGADESGQPTDLPASRIREIAEHGPKHLSEIARAMLAQGYSGPPEAEEQQEPAVPRAEEPPQMVTNLADARYLTDNIGVSARRAHELLLSNPLIPTREYLTSLFARNDMGLVPRVVLYEVLESGTGAGVNLYTPGAEHIAEAAFHVLPARNTAGLDLAAVDKEYQGKGLSFTVIDSLVELCRTTGCHQIRVEAGLDVGGYAWAMMGFDFRQRGSVDNSIDDIATNITVMANDAGLISEDEMVMIHDRILAETKDLSAYDVANYSIKLPPEFESILDWAFSTRFDAEHTEERKRAARDGRIGKAAMLGSHWDGVLRMDNLEVYEAYKKYRRERK